MGAEAARDVLIVYYTRAAPLREVILEHLYSFERYSNDRCYYLNLGMPWIPRVYRGVSYDLVVFHTTFLVQRFHPRAFARLVQRCDWIADLAVPKAILPQDEYVHADLLCRFIRDLGITHVFSNAEATEWPKIYPDVDREQVRFETVLTAYLSENAIERIRSLSDEVKERDVDIGYRAWDPTPELGRHGRLKGDVARVVGPAARQRGLSVDISTDLGDTITGEDWYRFLLRCKYTLGVEGGASVLDYDGSIAKCTAEYLGAHPDAGFEDVESACFPGKDGGLRLFALSPRQLECCATRTCQILVEGEYSGVLRPGEHYIELKRDFSNIDDVMDLVAQDDLRASIVERAWNDVVASHRYSYRSLVDRVLGRTRLALVRDCSSDGGHTSPSSAWRRVATLDRAMWRVWTLYSILRRLSVRVLGEGLTGRWTGEVKRVAGERSALTRPR